MALIKLGSAVLFLAAASGPLLVAQQPIPQATLQIDLGKTLHAVSPTLYGLMTEEINYSYDGGLYAEMVRNRVFQERDLSHPAHWYLVQKGQGSGTMQLDRTQGPSEALQSSLLLEVKKADASDPVGVLNEGYWGMALRPETIYHGSFYAKADTPDMGNITVALENDTTAKTIATASAGAPTTDWKRFEFTLHTGKIAASSENHLELTVMHPGKLRLSLVSLMPPTYKDRANGNRPDLMEMMAAMHPKFLRLPGGNYLEGDQIDERFNWKTTIGPLVDRPTHRSPWNYQSSDGMGLLEFLDWTEDLQIQPLLAVYAGYSLKGDHIEPGPALTPYVDDALDEIEFVMGDQTTHWGAIRAKLGHPAPFPLSYVEIGNEDWFDRSGSYEGRYAQFYKAIKAKYPQLQLIATDKLKRMKPDVQDDHYYLRAGDIFGEAHRYDGVDRQGPKIFVGEWATREGSPTSNFGAALGDASWMTMMERNSDLIVMASYAPLFVNVNPGGMQWESDLIGYNAMNSYGSPSYYAQAMFAESLGTEVPSSTISGVGERFFYSTTSDPSAGTVQIKLVNASSDAQSLQIALNGAETVASAGTLVSLTGSNPTETNTISSPDRIVPVRSRLKGAGKSFSHTVPPYSIEVLTLHVSSR
jgi:alpha-N-arabinofuranosidase